MVAVFLGGGLSLHDVVGVWCLVDSGGEFSGEYSEALGAGMVDLNVAVDKEDKHIEVAMMLT